MSKGLLALTALLLLPRVGANLSAQSVPLTVSRGTCSGGLRGGGPDCQSDRRLLVVVTLNGSAPSPLIQSIIGMAAGAGGAFALTPQNATASDSSVYAVLNVSRDASGNYRIDESLAGSGVKAADNCRGYSTGGSDDMGFGAFLALRTEALVRCAQNARGLGIGAH